MGIKLDKLQPGQDTFNRRIIFFKLMLNTKEVNSRVGGGLRGSNQKLLRL
jgi:hypothetical protein